MFQGLSSNYKKKKIEKIQNLGADLRLRPHSIANYRRSSELDVGDLLWRALFDHRSHGGSHRYQSLLVSRIDLMFSVLNLVFHIFFFFLLVICCWRSEGSSCDCENGGEARRKSDWVCSDGSRAVRERNAAVPS